MYDESLFSAMCNGHVVSLSKDILTEELDWNLHPAFKGVSLKHLICGADTEGQFSAHIVHIEAGCTIGEHTHPGKWEMHEVISGKGHCLLKTKHVAYETGSATIIPPDVKHQVVAEGKDLYILAKFVPALL